mgnify:CR=1 FL=1
MAGTLRESDISRYLRLEEFSGEVLLCLLVHLDREPSSAIVHREEHAEQVDLDQLLEARIVERFSAAADHPVALAFPEGEYLKTLLLRVVA